MRTNDGIAQQQWTVLFPWVIQVLGVLVFFLLTHFELPIPYVACMFVIGAIMGYGTFRTESEDQLT